MQEAVLCEYLYLHTQSFLPVMEGRQVVHCDETVKPTALEFNTCSLSKISLTAPVCNARGLCR